MCKVNVPVFFEETGSNHYFELNLTSLFRKLTGKKCIFHITWEKWKLIFKENLIILPDNSSIIHCEILSETTRPVQKLEEGTLRLLYKTWWVKLRGKNKLYIPSGCRLHMQQRRGAHIFQQSRNHLKIIGAREWHKSKFHKKDLQILGATIQNLATCRTWHLGLMHPAIKVLRQLPVQGLGWWDALLIDKCKWTLPQIQWSQTAIGQTGVNIRVVEDFQMVMHTNKDHCYQRHVIISGWHLSYHYPGPLLL